MRRQKLFLLLFISISCCGFSQPLPENPSDYILATRIDVAPKHSQKWGKRLGSQRFQLIYSPESHQLSLKAHPVLYIKNLGFKSLLQFGTVKTPVKKKEVIQNILEEHALLPAITKMTLDSLAHETSQEQYTKDLQDFAEGKRAKKWIYGQWLTIAQWDGINDLHNLTVTIKRPFKTVAVLRLDTLAIVALPYLPTLSNVQCTPIDRFFELRKLKGLGINNIKYQPYTGHDQDILTKKHGVFFPKNKYYPESESIESLQQYLNDNDLSILKADFYGYSSLEGDSLLNRNLQEKRATYLYQKLNEMSHGPIEADTIGFADGYEALLALGKKNSITWMASMPKTQLRDTLQKDSLLLARLEPLLEQSRKAELQLVLSKRLNKEERISKAFRILNQTAYRVIATRSGHISTLEQQRVSGILQYLFRLYVNNEISSAELVYAVNAAPNSRFVRVLFTYMLIQQIERDRPIQVDSALWFSKLNEFDKGQIFEKANEDIISLIYSTSIATNMKAMLRSMAVDIQFYTFRYIRNGTLHPSVLCRFSYPNSSGFYALTLNQYAFIQQLPPEFAVNVSCYSGSSYQYPTGGQARRFNSEEVEYLAERLELQARTFRNDFENEPLVAPSYYHGSFSDYYYFLKILFINEDETIRQLVNQSDQLIEFDLFYFVNYQVDSFDPFKNHWLEEDIPLEKIASLLRRLMREPGRLCPVMLENISLSFHLKTLYYIDRYYNPADPYQMALARDALTYISNYYRRRKAAMTPSLEAILQRQLNFFYRMPGTREISEYRLY